MGFSLNEWLGGWREAIDGDRTRLRTAVEADTAAGAAFAGIARGVDAVSVQFRSQLQALGRAGIDTESAALAFFCIDEDVSTRWSSHNHLVAVMG
jgi:hypothetical protein